MNKRFMKGVAVLALVLGISPLASAQEDYVVQFRTPTLRTYIPCGSIESPDEIRLTAPDLDKLQVEKMETGDLYYVNLPIEVAEDVPEGHVFWYFIQEPNLVSHEFVAWEFVNSEGELCHADKVLFRHKGVNILMSSGLQMKEPIKKGTYQLIVFYKKRPKYIDAGHSIRICAGYSPRKFFDETFWFAGSTKEEIFSYMEDLYKRSYNYTNEEGQQLSIRSMKLKGSHLIRELSDGRVSDFDLTSVDGFGVNKQPLRGNYFVSDDSGKKYILAEIASEGDARRLRNALYQLRNLLVARASGDQ